MKIDLHIHSAVSDGALSIEDVFKEATRRKIDFLAITDHDNVDSQEKASKLAKTAGIRYVSGVELNVTFPYQGKSYSLDFLGYGFDYTSKELQQKLMIIREHREKRGRQIIANLNGEFRKEGWPLFTNDDLRVMHEGIDGVLNRPHIADYLIKKGIVATRQEAFDKYLVRCDVPKYPLPLEEASALIQGAGGRLALAHPNDPHGTSLVSITKDLNEQTKIIQEQMPDYIDGVECWHSRNDSPTTQHYVEFCRKRRLLMTGGSDCHQKPILMGTVDIPEWVSGQFKT